MPLPAAGAPSRILVNEAITYAVAAENVAGAIALIESHRQATMNAEQWQQLERWLNLLPRQHVDEHPQLLVLEAWILHKRQRLTEIPARLDLAEALLKENRLPEKVQRYLGSEIDALRSQQYFSLGNATLAYMTAQNALDTTPLEHSGVRGVAWVFLAGGLFLSHGLQAALNALADAPSNGRPAHSSEHFAYPHRQVLVILDGSGTAEFEEGGRRTAAVCRAA